MNNPERIRLQEAREQKVPWKLWGPYLSECLEKSEQMLAQQRSELAHLSRVVTLSALAGSLAHELNQPLTAILSNAQAALRFLDADPPNVEEVREILRDIVNADKRAADVIKGVRQLLVKGETQRDELNITEVVQDIIRLLHSELVNAGVVVVTECASALPNIVGDRAQLQQVMLNLVLNACDAMAANAAGDRKLIVTTEFSEDKHIQVCVADQGHGIPPQNLERVFEPFFTTSKNGLGLGLSISRQIVVAHGGSMWATNNSGRGARFYFTVAS